MPQLSAFDERRRLRLLEELEILDTGPEPGFDALAELVRTGIGWPIVLVSLVDEHRQWFKARVGLGQAETPREHAFCAHALRSDDLFEVPDALADPRFAGNPLVTGPTGIRAYAGRPLIVMGARLGTVCVIHTQAARLSAAQRVLLGQVSTAASALLTERLNRARLTRERSRLADFSAASGDWQWEIDDQGHVAWLSEGFEASTGLRATAQLGRRFPDLPLHDVRGAPITPPRTLTHLLSRGEPFHRAVIALPRRGGPSWVSVSGRPFGEGGRRGLRGTARDVSALVRAEQARERDADRLRKLADEVPGALYQFRIDAEGRWSFPFVTGAFGRLFECTTEQVLEDAAQVIGRIHPDDARAFAQAVETSRRHGTAWQAMFRVQLPSSGERHLHAHSTPEPQADGSCVWHGLVTDVTEQVRERAERDRLMNERDRARREADARGEAMSKISHELRTPLNAILGFAQLMQATLREREDAAHVADWGAWVNQVHRAASHLLALVNEILRGGAWESRRLVIELQAVDTPALVMEVLEIVRPQARSRGQRLRLAPPAEEPLAACPVLADKRALRQVLFNLVGNALKYTPEGSTVDVIVEQGSDGRVRLSVRDDGPGISEEVQSRLFMPFTRGEHDVDAPEGTGLGLAISRRLVRAMGGQLTLHSARGEGCTFCVELPGAPSDTGDASAPSPDSLFGHLAAAEPSRQPPAPFPAARLLYVEDEPVNALLMQEFVNRTPPLTLHVAATLAEGVTMARALSPDLVLADMNLPDGDGFELLRRLRGLDGGARLRTIVLSADAMPEQVSRALDAGFHDYLTKPVDFTLLRQRLREWLSDPPPPDRR